MPKNSTGKILVIVLLIIGVFLVGFALVNGAASGELGVNIPGVTDLREDVVCDVSLINPLSVSPSIESVKCSTNARRGCVSTFSIAPFFIGGLFEDDVLVKMNVDAGQAVTQKVAIKEELIRGDSDTTVTLTKGCQPVRSHSVVITILDDEDAELDRKGVVVE